MANQESIKHRYILTGTPILNSPLDLYQQYKILDAGETFGKNYFAFRAEYFRDDNTFLVGKHNYFPKFVPIKSKFDELTDKVYSKATRVLKKDCLDLPPLIIKTVKIPMAAEQAKAYKEMKKEYITFLGDIHGGTHASVAMQATTKAIRLQQICCGFLKTEEGQEIPFQHNPKLDITRDIVEQLVPNHKVIIWTSFICNYKMLADMLEGSKIKYVLLTGQQTNKQKEEAIDNFKSDADVRVIVCNRKTGGTGVNLTSASYSIVYGRDFNLANELQSEARNHRAGSEIHSSITKINLVMEGTIDESIMQALENKQSISDVILDLKI
jgi:SNF2 family DNA or RNA helicase